MRRNPFILPPQPTLFSSKPTRQRISWKNATPRQLVFAVKDETLGVWERGQMENALKEALRDRYPLDYLIGLGVNGELAEAMLAGLVDELRLEAWQIDAEKEKAKTLRKQAQSEARAVESEKNFKAWFGNSKVVDEQGKPLVVYHGSSKSGFTKFSTNYIDRRRSHEGFFFASNWQLACSYIEGSCRDAVIPEIFDSLEDALDAARDEDADFSVETQYYDREEGSGVTYDSEDDLLEQYEFDDEDDVEDFIKENVAKAYKVYDVDGYRVGEFDEDELDAMLETINDRGGDRRPGIYEVYLKIEDPLIIDAGHQNWDDIRLDGDWNPVKHGAPEFDPNLEEPLWISYMTRDLVVVALDAEHDGLIIKNVYDAGGGGHGTEHGDVYVVFKPNQIKSADKNIGTYSLDDADIRKNRPSRARRTRK
jgi:hypothetical protein